MCETAVWHINVLFLYDSELGDDKYVLRLPPTCSLTANGV